MAILKNLLITDSKMKERETLNEDTFFAIVFKKKVPGSRCQKLAVNSGSWVRRLTEWF